MAWIESHQSLATHRKLLPFARQLGISRPEAVGTLHYLWWWALDNAPDGLLTNITPEDIAEVVYWKGNPDDLHKALCDNGWIDDGETPTLHDWDDYAGKLISQRKSNAEKQKRHREQLRNRDITVTSPSRNGATVPNRTQPITTTAAREEIIKTIFKNYESNIEMLTPMVSDNLKSAIDEYPEDWINDAIKEAVNSNVRKWRYIEKILLDWKTKGRGNGKNQKRTHNPIWEPELNGD